MTGSNGEVRFQVFADGQVVYDSGAMEGDSPTQSVNVNIAGAQEVKLVVTNEGDYNADHADWANARFVR